MAPERRNRIETVRLLLFGFLILFPWETQAAETPTMAIEEAKFAIEQARKAGAEQKAADDLAAAKSLLSQAEKEYEARKSFLSRTRRMVSSDKAKEEEIIYLATMATIKGQAAEAKARKDGVSSALKETQRDISNDKSTLEILKKTIAEAEAKSKELEQARQTAAELEERKKKALEDAQKKAWELEALRQREIQEARAREARMAAEREKEQTEARLQAERLAFQKEKEEAEIRAKEERMAALQQRTAAMEREKEMLTEAGKIPQSTVKAGDEEIIITLLAINLFTPQTELNDSGKTILEQVGNYLKKYSSSRITIRGHTDSVGKPNLNQTLSEKRAKKVKEFLVYEEIPPGRIVAEGVGSSQPVATNSTEAGRALNRRVEILIATTP